MALYYLDKNIKWYRQARVQQFITFKRWYTYKTSFYLWCGNFLIVFNPYLNDCKILNLMNRGSGGPRIQQE